MALVLDAFINRHYQSIAEFDEWIGKTAQQVPSRTSTASSIDGESPWSSADTPEGAETPLSPTSPIGEKSEQHLTRKTLAAVWNAMLNLPPDNAIDGEDNFFDLGGDSIMAMKLVGEARDRGLVLSVADVFRNPRFDDMAAIIRVESPDMADQGVPGIDSTIERAAKDGLYERFSLLAASNVDAFLQTNIVPQVGVFRGGLADVLPATDFQSLAVTGALLSSQWMLNYFYLDGDGPLDLGRLRRACFRVVQALDILRTVFVPSENRFLQVVLRTLRPAFHVVEVDDDKSLECFAERLNEKEESAPRLGEPFVEFTVVRHRHTSRHRILLRISHAQYDGVCLPKILEALQAAYLGQTIRSPPSFANYLRASAGSLTSAHYEHWSRLLEGSSMTEVVHRKRPDHHKSASGRAAWLKKTVQLPPVESGNITTATVVKAAWAYVLAQLSASPDVVFGHTISGRNAAVEGIENMIGPCLNLVPVRVRFDDHRTMTARDLLRQVQDQQVANMPHEVLGFREIIRRCTDWPAWTYFTTTVQHQNVDRRSCVRLGDVEYAVGVASAAQGDLADLCVLSQRAPESYTDNDNTYEISLSFAEDGPVPRELARAALDMLCDTVARFAAHPDCFVTLPSSPAELPSSLPLQFPLSSYVDKDNSNEEGEQEAERAFQSAQLRHLAPEQLADLSARVTSAWRAVLPPAAEEQQQGAASSPGLLDNNLSDDDTPSFFALGGDLTDLARLAWLFLDDGTVGSGSSGPYSQPPPRLLEDLADHPTVRGHMAIVAASLPARRRTWRSEVDHPSGSGTVSNTGDGASKLRMENGGGKGEEKRDRTGGQKKMRPRRSTSPLAKALRMAKTFTKRRIGVKVRA